MRALMVGSYIPYYGGVAIHVKRLKRELTDRGISVELVTYPRSSGPAVDDQAEFRLWCSEMLKETLRGKYTLVHIHTAGLEVKSGKRAHKTTWLGKKRAPLEKQETKRECHSNE